MCRLFHLLAASLLIVAVSGCGKTTPAAETTAAPTEAPTEAATTAAAEETTTEADLCSGDELDIDTIADGEEYAQKKGGPVETGDDLEFEAGKGGCWTNYKPPVDELDFLVFNDGSKFKECQPGIPDPPGGKVIGVVTPQAADGSAAYHSCAVICSEGPPTITVDGSHTDGVKFDACLTDAFVDDPLLRDCTHILFNKPTKVGKEERPTIYNIVLVATNFDAKSYVVVKSIKVETKKCDDSGKICEEAGCTFDKDSCNYKTSDESQSQGTEFKAYNDPSTVVGNADTGVNAAADTDPGAAAKDGFLATPENPGDLIVAEAEVSEVQSDDIEMEFEYYEATDQNSAKVCFDDISNCPFESNEGVSLEDRKWQKGKAKIPKGTKKVLLVAENKGDKFGAAGFNEITFSKGGKPICDIVQRRRK